MKSSEQGPSQESDYLAGLPPEIVNRPGHLWTPRELETVLCLIFDPYAGSRERAAGEREGDEDDAEPLRVRNGNLCRLFAYILKRARDASEQEVMDAVSECGRLVFYEGRFLAELRAIKPKQGFAESDLPFVDWFIANYPACAKQVTRSIAKQFEHALAAIERRKAVQPFGGIAESLVEWIDRLLRLPDEEGKAACSGAVREKLKEAVVALEAETPFDPKVEEFKAWYLRAGTEMVWRRIRAYEETNPFEPERMTPEEWFVPALRTLPVPSILLRGYKSYDPARGTFGQWFYGVVVARTIFDLRDERGKQAHFISTKTREDEVGENEEWDVEKEANEDEEKAFGGLAKELLETALQFAGQIGPPVITARREEAFARYAQAIRMRRISEMSYAEMAGEFKSQANARQLVSRGQASLFALFGIGVNVAAAVEHARSVAANCATREEARRLDLLAPFLLAVYDLEVEEADHLEEPWIAEVASRLGTTRQVVWESVREAWKVLLVTLDADGQSFHNFKR